MNESLFLGSNETSLNNIPVYNVPNGLDIVGANVSVGKVISVFPNLMNKFFSGQS
jgi:hypothetical protein